MENELIICPKSNELVDCCSCVAIKNLSKVMAEYFARKVCSSVRGCPNEDYCTVFECGWTSVGNMLQTTFKEE